MATFSSTLASPPSGPDFKFLESAMSMPCGVCITPSEHDNSGKLRYPNSWLWAFAKLL
jgi:hypothetical protein